MNEQEIQKQIKETGDAINNQPTDPHYLNTAEQQALIMLKNQKLILEMLVDIKHKLDKNFRD
jgi:hypothetical protein